MSETLNDLNDIVTDRLPSTGDLITNLRTGGTFRGEVEPIEDMELNEAMGRDAREAIVVNVPNASAIAAPVKLNDRLQFVLLGAQVIVKAVRRTANPAKPTVQIGCQLLTDKDS